MSYQEKKKKLLYDFRCGVINASQYNAKLVELQDELVKQQGELTDDEVDEEVEGNEDPTDLTEDGAVDEVEIEIQPVESFEEVARNIVNPTPLPRAAKRVAQFRSSAESATVPSEEFLAVAGTKMASVATRVARRWLRVPDKMSDNEAVKAGVISPELLMLFMSIFNEVLQNCLSNNSLNAYQRIRSYCDEQNEFAKMSDTIRLWWMTDRWMNRLGLPRDRGDVRIIVDAMTQEVGALTEEDFKTAQMEALFLTV